MKLALTLLFAFLVQFSFSQDWLEKMQSSGNVFEAKQDFDAYWHDKTPEKGSGYKQFMRWYNYWAPRTFPSGDISSVNQFDGIQQHWDLQDYKNSFKSSSSPWSTMGPTTTNSGYNGIGRINTIEFHPTQPNTWFVGTPGGGLWKTTDAGSSWSPLTDFLTNLGISDIAISTTNPDVMYIATGDRDARDTYSFGVLKSTDGGQNWSNTGLTSTVQNTWTTNRVLIDPNNNSTIIVATGDGIYRSTDAGASFTHVQTSGHFITMEFNPANPNIIYAGEYDYWNEEASFFKSTNNGQTWTAITSGLPASNCRRVHIGVTPANSNYVYLIASNNDNGMEGFYRSTNSGISFSLMASSPNVLHNGDGSGTNGQGWYDLSLAVSSTNENEVYVGGVNMWKTTNGGSNFTKMTHWWDNGSTVIHADQHWFKYHNGSLYACNDGGLYISSDGANSFSDVSNGLVITQYYRLSNDQNTFNRLIAGAQDNGSDMLNSGTWTDVNGGDGMECIIDHTDPSIVFSATQYGNISRSTDGGNNFTDVSPDPGNGAWITPYTMDPSDHDIMYCGYNDMYKSTNNGVNWTQTTSGLSTELLRFIEVSASNSNVVYCSSYDQLFKSTNGGTSFSEVTGTLPVGNASISSICIDPTDENKVWITFSGYSSGNKVYRTDNGAANWVNASGTLPNLPVNKLIYQNGSAGILYAGTDVGVYWWDPVGLAWDIYGTDLPNVIVSDLDIQYAQGIIRAATYGRGVWEIPMSPTSPPVASYTASSTSLCQGETINYTNLSTQGDTYLWTFDGGTPSSSTDTNPSVIYNSPGTYNTKLIVYNQNGSDTLEVLNHIQVEADLLETIALGNATNIYTNIANRTQPIVVDNDLNTVIFSHRQNTNEHGGTNGTIRYDYSTDDGMSWNLDNGILNPSATAGTNDGRYPQVSIYNPGGNTNPANAHLVYTAPTTATSWNGYVSGNGAIGSGTYSENYNQGAPSNTLIPGGLTKGATGVYWSIDALYNGTNYTGFQLMKGTWNGSEVVWSVQQTFTPNFNTDVNGAPSIGDWNIAFDPSGQNGWIVFLSHLNGSITNYQYYPIFYQTTDGGNTWSAPIEVNLNTFPSITSNITGGFDPATAFDIDITVDANGNPHTLFNVCSGNSTNYAVYSGEWMGACHLHHNGTTWEADILGDIQTLRYDFPNGAIMDNTPQISTSDDGNIMAFGWADSDELLTGGDNSIPFMSIVAYNVNTDVYSSLETADICSLDPGQMFYMHYADRLMETTQGYEVATVISDVNASGDDLDETGHLFFSYPIPNVCSATADLSSVASACADETVTIVDNSTNTSGYTYSWDVDNDGNVDYTNSGNVSHTFTTAGFKTISLVLDDGSGCLASATANITINSNPDLDVIHPSSICGLVQIDYTNNSSVISPATYDWDFDGDNNTDATTNSNQTYTPAAAGTINGSLTVIDANGCTNTLNLPVQVDLQPTASFTVQNTGCVGETISITDQSTNGSVYSWDMDNNGVEEYNIAGNVSHIYSSTGLYTIELEVVNGNCSDSYATQISIENDPVVDFNVVHQGGNSYLFQDLTTGGGTYLWNFGDGNTSTTAGDVSHTYSNEDAHTVTLTVTNNCGNDSHVEEISSTASLTELENSIRIYPNPSNGEFTVQLQNFVGTTFIVSDNLGRTIAKGELINNMTQLDLSEYSSGMYYLQLHHEKDVIVKKIELKK
jgi:PKD repeat protein